ncbi:hypothetical protein CYMTET_12514 [Cymbomonas tetramitiformis]|uniref:HEAT repeat protein n=1 Tax=Cymbomonas tetramitiformis TaxID=36881 RepID=A0AAE0GKD4_9CHLO|nr:hypothetical protein CYMTET_12514 [Cymbomonas tetramitiformis]
MSLTSEHKAISIDQLPLKTLSVVFSFQGLCCRDLASICCTSRRFRKAAGPQAAAICALTTDNPDEDRKKALLLLGNLGEQAKPYLEHMVVYLDCFAADVRREAFNALCQVGDEALLSHFQAILTRLADDDSDIGFSALQAVCRVTSSVRSSSEAYQFRNIFSPYIRTLLAYLEHNLAEVRARALMALGYLPSLAASHIDVMLARLEDEDTDVRAVAIIAIRELGELAEPYMDNILATLKKDTDDCVEFAAMVALSEKDLYREHTASRMGHIVTWLEHEQPSCRDAAVKVLQRAARHEEVDMRAILERLHHRNPEIRLAAMNVIEGLELSHITPSHSQDIVVTVSALLDDADVHVREAASKLLESMANSVSSCRKLPRGHSLQDLTPWTHSCPNVVQV